MSKQARTTRLNEAQVKLVIGDWLTDYGPMLSKNPYHWHLQADA